MSFNTFSILIVVPFIISGLSMAWAQRRFLKTYRMQFNPKERISTEEVIKELANKRDKATKNILNQDIIADPGIAIKLYFTHYKDNTLEREAKLVRILIITTALIPLLGILLFFII